MYLDDNENALKYFKEAIQILPDEPKLWYNIACVESLRKNQIKSLECLNRAVELDKNYIDIAKADNFFGRFRDSKELKELIEKKYNYKF